MQLLGGMKLNLLVLGPYGEETSGPSRVLTEVVHHLSQEVNIVALSPKKRREINRTDFVEGNLQVIFQPCGQIPGIPGSNQWVETFRIWKRLNSLDFKPDLIWIHNASLFLAFYLSKYRNVPVVSTVHGVFGGFYRSEAAQRLGGIMTGFLSLQSMLLQRFELNHTSAMTTYSSYLQELVYSIAPNAYVQVIPNGVNTDRFSGAKPTREKAIIYVGRMAKIKGVHILIEGFKSVVQSHPDWELWLVGGAFDQPRSFFEQFQDDLTSSRIKFLGAIPNKDLPSILNRAGLFVMPTLRDGFEIALMEAMASGIPCLTTAAFERTSLYGGFAELVPPNDSDAMGQKLSQMIDNYSTYIDSHTIENRVARAKQFDWRRIASKYEEFFKEMQEWRK